MRPQLRGGISYELTCAYGKGGHGFPKVSIGCAIPDPSMLFQGWPTRKEGGLQPSSTPLDTPRCMPM
jgi:hypothetical protein